MLKVLKHLVDTGIIPIFVSVKEVLNQVPICIGKKKRVGFCLLFNYILQCLMVLVVSDIFHH